MRKKLYIAKKLDGLNIILIDNFSSDNTYDYQKLWMDYIDLKIKDFQSPDLIKFYLSGFSEWIYM